jgi:hypothetical protein
LIPDEPLNRDAFYARNEIIETYSFNRYTKTLPAQRVKLDEPIKKKLFHKKND